MKHKQANNIFYVIRLEKGEKIIEGIIDFCNKNKIKNALFFGLGAISRAELMHYVVDTKKYSSKVIEEPLEIANMTGNVMIMDSKPILHTHITVSNKDMKPYAGHLKEAAVAATCEIFLVKLDSEINRKYSEEIGLNLLDI